MVQRSKSQAIVGANRAIKNRPVNQISFVFVGSRVMSLFWLSFSINSDNVYYLKLLIVFDPFNTGHLKTGGL